MVAADSRELRGLAILAMGNQIRRIDADIYQVRSQNATAGIGLRGIEPIGSPELITVALDLYFKGLSLRKITDHLNDYSIGATEARLSNSVQYCTPKKNPEMFAYQFHLSPPIAHLRNP